MTLATQPTTQPAIQYPDDDGEPMSDNTLQYKWMVTITDCLETLVQKSADVFVAGNLLWYPVEGDDTIRAAPDSMVVFGRPKGRRSSYKQWEEGNIAPQVVFEILAPGNRPDELARKFEFYERYGVEEYYVYDPDDGTLEGWLRAGDHLEAIPNMAGFVSPRIRIRFEPGHGPNNLRIFNPDGTPFLTYQEVVERAEAQRQRAEAERQRADDERRLKEAERQRADDERRLKEAECQRADDERQLKEAERQRAERYAAKLRELGVEPD